MFTKQLSSFKWFLKSSDSNYFFVDILLQKLDSYDYTQPWYLGYVVTDSSGSYCSGKGGYILSQGALKLVGPHLDSCFASQAEEDIMMGQCLHNLGVQPTSMSGIHNTSLLHLLLEGNLMDTLPVSFSDVPAKQMFEWDYFFYNENQ